MSSKESAKPHEPAMQRSQPEQTQQASPEAAQLNLSAQVSAASPPPVNPNTIAQLQRIAGNQAVSRMLMHKPTAPAAPEAIPSAPQPAPIQRQIIGTTDPNLWANEIGDRVFNEQDKQIKAAVTRLHSVSEPIFVASYDQLVKNIRAGKYDEQLKKSANESPNEAKYDTQPNPNVQPIATLIGQLSNDYGGALSSHPLVAQVWTGQWNNQPKKAWTTPGIREVLNVFLYFYTNADTIHAYFAQNQQLLTATVLETLHNFLLAHLGAGFGGTQEIQKLMSGALKFNTWFKEGLDAAERTLNANKNDVSVVDSYVTFNLDNETKQYFRKLIVAQDPPGGARRNQTEFDTDELSMRLISGISSKSLYLPMVHQYLKDTKTELSNQSLRNVIDSIRDLVPHAAPDENEISEFVSEKQNNDFDIQVPMMKIMGEYQQDTGSGLIDIPQSTAVQWIQKNAEVKGKVFVVAKSDKQRYVVVGKNGLFLRLKKA